MSGGGGHRPRDQVPSSSEGRRFRPRLPLGLCRRFALRLRLGRRLGEDLLGDVEVRHLLRRRRRARRSAPAASGLEGQVLGSARFTLSEIRRRFSSISRILTQVWSPGETTSLGFSTWCSASSEIWTSPSTPGMISTKAPNATTLVTLPSSTSPGRYSSSTLRHGSSWVCFRPSEIRWRSRSMSRTFTFTVSPTERTSEGWLTWLQESSEMWISPSIPSRSTKAPKSTMLEILPSTTMPGWRRPRICSRPPCAPPRARRGARAPRCCGCG